ncbi:armadillo-type protein [Entophlyctis helioformis]|nr:armadillo-type protein [Entophlyctis helioformis]
MSDGTAQLRAVLEQAASPVPEVRRPAEGVLSQWEKSPGFHSTLQDVFHDRSLDTKVRSLAIIYLKNGIDKYWRKTAPNCVQPDEKQRIRARQLTMLDEPQKQLAVHQAVATAKMARVDFPTDWPDLLHTLIPLVQTAFAAAPPLTDAILATQHNSLYTLHLVVKALCTKTLPASRRILLQLAPDIFRFVASVFYDRANLFVSSAQQVDAADPHHGLDSTLSLARVALKCLRRLIIHGFTDFTAHPEAVDLFRNLVGYLRSFVQIRQSLPKASNGVYATLSSISILIGKVYLGLAQDRIASFVLAPDGLAVVRFYWSLLETVPRSADDETMETIFIQSLRILKLVIKNPAFNVVSESHKDERMPQVISLLETQLFLPDNVVSLARLLVTKYIKLSDEDLASWENDPESYIQEEEADHWEYNLRSCSEKVFMELVSKHRPLLCPMIVSMLREVSVETTQQNMLLKDAVFAAVGLTAHDLFDWIDFADWARTSLLHEAHNKSPDVRVIRRRVSWVIGKWVSVKSPVDLRPALFETVLSLMARDDDLAVRLTAVSDLQACVDDFDFVGAQFQPYLQTSVTLFMHLLEDVDEFESQMKILNCLIVIIERMEGQILPFMAPILHVLPELWKRSEGQNIFRALIVTIMAKLMKALRADSVQLQSMVVPILQQSIDPKQPGYIYLLEEGLELWLVTLQNATSSTADLIALVPFAIAHLDYGTESLKRVLHILESYVLLDARSVLSAHAVTIMGTIAHMMGDLKPDASSALLRTVDITMQACQADDCFSAISQVMASGPLLGRILQIVMDGKEMSYIVAGYLAVLARFAVYDPQLFVDTITYAGTSWTPPVGDLVGHLLDKWFDKMDAMGHGKQRKLTALAMASLIGTGHPSVLARINGVFGVLTSVASEISKLDRDESLAYTYEPRDEDDDEDSVERQRTNQLMDRDPVLADGSLALYMRNNLAALEHKLGGPQQLHHLLSTTADPDLLYQMQHFTK